MTPQLSVVVPCFNEAAVIEKIHSAVDDVLGPSGIDFEICYVDDGSTDRTRDIIDGLGATDRRVRYSVLSRNFGKEAAILAGLRMSCGRAVVVLDADLQHPPELIPRMVELHEPGYDQVISRLLSFNNRPLRLAIYAGFWCLLAAVAYAAWVGFDVALHGAAVPGYATLLMVVVGVGGIQLITVGIIGEYVGRIYHEVKRRPPLSSVKRTSTPLPGPTSPPQNLDTLPTAPAKTARQFATFVAIGFVNTAVYLSIYAVLNPWIPYLTAHVLGYAVSIIVSFLLNSCITCRTRPTWCAFLRYPLSSGFNLVASGALLFLAVSRLGMDKNVAALTAGVLVTPVSFLLARRAINSGRRPANIADTNRSDPVEREQNDPTLG